MIEHDDLGPEEYAAAEVGAAMRRAHRRYMAPDFMWTAASLLVRVGGAVLSVVAIRAIWFTPWGSSTFNTPISGIFLLVILGGLLASAPSAYC